MSLHYAIINFRGYADEFARSNENSGAEYN
jgi:hypothetical protein